MKTGIETKLARIELGTISQLKPIWLFFLIVTQLLFIVAGLAIIFWVLNKWDSDQRLDAVFGAGMGSYCFLLTWLLIRKWVRQREDLWRR